MKKLLCVAVLVISFLGCSSAYAILGVGDVVSDPIAEESTFLTSIQTGINNTLKKVEDAKRDTMDYFNKLSWVKELKTTADQLKGIYDSAAKLTAEITGVTDAASSIASKLAKSGGGTSIKSGDQADYGYANQLPSDYTPNFHCDLNGVCSTSLDALGGGPMLPNNGYKGKASNVSSTQLRDDLKINNFADSLSFKGAQNDKARYVEAAEKNAQEVAVIQAMAKEAYAQANNRMVVLNDLDNKITDVDPKKNTLKYMADLQAEIQVEQGYLSNEQSKLAALAIMQQSQKDMYEQQKKEIAANLYRNKESNLWAAAERVLILAANKAALSAVANQYKEKGDKLVAVNLAAHTAVMTKYNTDNNLKKSTKDTQIADANTKANNKLVADQKAAQDKEAAAKAAQSDVNKLNEDYATSIASADKAVADKAKADGDLADAYLKGADTGTTASYKDNQTAINGLTAADEAVAAQNTTLRAKTTDQLSANKTAADNWVPIPRTPTGATRMY